MTGSTTKGKGRGRDPQPYNAAVMDCYIEAHEQIKNKATAGHSDLEALHARAEAEFLRRLNSNHPAYTQYGKHDTELALRRQDNARSKEMKATFRATWGQTRRSYVRATEAIQDLDISKMSKLKAQKAIGAVVGHLYGRLVKVPGEDINQASGKPRRMWAAYLGALTFEEQARMVSYRAILSKEDQIVINLIGVTLSKANSLGASSRDTLKAFFPAA